MEIESYELFHIGIKLNPNTLNLEVLVKNLKPGLEEMGYLTTEEPSKATVDVTTGALTQEKIVLAKKEGVEVSFNILKIALNYVGDNPCSVRDAFRDSIKIFERLEFELDKIFLFYEILVRMNIKTDKTPTEVIKNSSNLNLEPLEDIGDLAVQTIKITPKDKDPSSYNWFNLVIEPKLASPRSRYYIYLLYRSPSKDELLNFQEGLEDRIKNMIESMESR
jgi:hypothetical protein